ncbi:MAG: adenylate/guanylate cyclase domain-containing protein [Akkermansiaceae bacterium]|nr:adenylate/guanylate cyclase domain-containing protein [Akkermansiaceae bacterium]
MSKPPPPKPAGKTGRLLPLTRIATAVLGAAMTVAAGYAALSRAGGPLVSASYDVPFMAHRGGGAGDLRLVYLSDVDGTLLDRQPQAKLLDALNEAGARAVLYDVIFNEPSKDPQVDQEFAAAMRRFRGVNEAGNPIPGQPHRLILLACERKTSTITAAALEQLIVPNDTLLDAADDFGLVAVDDDSFFIRKLPVGTRDEPSLIWKAAVALGAKLDEPERLSPQRWLNFGRPPPHPAVPASVPVIPSCKASTVLGGSVNPGFFHHKIVLIGGEPGVLGLELGKDLFNTPFHRYQLGGKLPLMSGVEMQANGLANLLQGNWLVRSDRRFDLTLVIIVGLLLGAGFTLLRPVRGIAVAIVLVTVATLAGVLAVHQSNFWFPWSVPAFLQVPMALVWGVASQSYIERFFRLRLTREQAAIRAAFAKYLSPQMLDRLTELGFNTNLGGEKIHAAMMFTDLEAFTDMCERVHDPERIVDILNDYFERTTGNIVDDDGIIIKFIGDAIFAAWGAPMPDPEAPAKAANAAWKLFENKLVVDGEELKTRVGLHYGEVVAGNVGSARRVDYTLIGDAVNLASRLEGINKYLGTSILMSEAVRRHLGSEFRVRRVGVLRVKGRHEPVEVFELLGPARQAVEPPWIGAYHQALAAMEGGDPATALAGFETVNESRGPLGDGPSRFFAKRIRQGDPIENGVVELKEK